MNNLPSSLQSEVAVVTCLNEFLYRFVLTYHGDVT
jgi:hypothetical protein